MKNDCAVKWEGGFSEEEIFISFISLAGLVVSVILLGEEREYWVGLGLEDSIENTEPRAGNKRGAILLHYKHLHTLEPSATAHLHNGITKYLFESLYCVLSQKVWQRFFSFSNCLVVSIFSSAGHSVLTAAECLIIEYCPVWSVVVVWWCAVVSTTTAHIGYLTPIIPQQNSAPHKIQNINWWNDS